MAFNNFNGDVLKKFNLNKIFTETLSYLHNEKIIDRYLIILNILLSLLLRKYQSDHILSNVTNNTKILLLLEAIFLPRILYVK